MADGDRLLAGYFNDIVERDMRERVAARSTMPLRQLVQILYESAGSELSARRAATAIGVTDATTALYLDAAEAAFLAFSCPFFAWSARQRSARQRKWYPIDPGLRRVVVTRTGKDRGKQLECATYLVLRRRYRDVCYWRNGGEVDFVVLQEGHPVPIQVTWDEPLERHQKGIDAFYKAHRDTREAVFVTAGSSRTACRSCQDREAERTQAANHLDSRILLAMPQQNTREPPCRIRTGCAASMSCRTSTSFTH